MSKYSSEFNINNLFDANIEDKTNTTLDINNLCNIKSEIYEFDTKIIKKIISLDREFLIKIFNNEYKKCCDLIVDTAQRRKTQIRFTVIDHIQNNSLYKPEDCLYFIQGQLKTKNIYSTIINNTNILIDWSHFNTEIIYK